MSVRASINPTTLGWAREAAGWSVDELATRVNVRPEVVAAWERSEAQPTLRQLQIAARALGRTSASFLISPPDHTGVPDTPDFRGQNGHELSRAAIREMRRIAQYRDYFLDLPHESADHFPLTNFNWDTVEHRADDLRELLGTEAALHLRLGLGDWIAAVEATGVLVFQATSIDLEEFRGVSVFHKTAPIVLLNGADSEPGRTFTLFHELAHLANRSSGLCLNVDTSEEEVLANRFAAEFLMPQRLVAQALAGVADDAARKVDAVRTAFGTSHLASAIRLRTLGHLDDDELERVREESRIGWEEVRRKQRAKDGFPPHWLLRKRDLSATYLNAVLDAIDTRRIDYMDATYMLNAKVPTIDRMREAARMSGGTR